jgi:hypothetical protein
MRSARRFVPGALVFLAALWASPAVPGAEPLEAEVVLTRARFRPGCRVEAEAYLTNRGEAALQVAPYGEAWRGWMVSREGKPVAPCATKSYPGQATGAFAGRFTIPPGRKVLVQVLPLHEAFDVAREGAYSLRFVYEVSEPSCAGAEALGAMRKQGFWTGRLESPPAAFQVDAGAPLDPVGRTRTVQARIASVEAKDVYVIDKGGEAGAYPGLVFTAIRDGKPLGTLRYTLVFSEANPWGDKRLTPVDLREPAAPGDTVEALKDASGWMRSVRTADGGTAMNGLALELDMTKNRLAEGEAWKGRLVAVNRGPTPEILEPSDGIELNLETVGGEAPEMVRCIGAGMRAGPGELRRGCVTLAPGGRHELVAFKGGDWESQLGAWFGTNCLAFRFGPGTYRLSFFYRRDAAGCAALDLPEIWTGSIVSNVVTVFVGGDDGPGGQETVKGLQLLLKAASSKDYVSGGLRFRNAGGEPVSVDYLAEMTLEVRTPDGKPVVKLPCPTNWTDRQKEGGRETLKVRIDAGGEKSYTAFNVFKTMLVVGIPNMAELPEGEYLLQAEYRRASPGGEEEGPAAAWTGTLKSNVIRIRVPGREE